MKQTSVRFEAERDARRRPEYLRGRSDRCGFQTAVQALCSLNTWNTSARVVCQNTALSPLNTDIYPKIWDRSDLPEIGCQKVLVSDTSSEFSEIVGSFTKTVSGHVVKKLWRLQNPSLWQVFQWQKEQMEKINWPPTVNEKRLFHSTEDKNIDAICYQNFDWRLCGAHGTKYGQGSYFARDALYSHMMSTNLSKLPLRKTWMMFVARVLVGNYTIGNPQMRRPPEQPGSSLQYYDSCVDTIPNPAVFVVFEKHQIYPEYLLEYELEESRHEKEESRHEKKESGQKKEESRHKKEESRHEKEESRHEKKESGHKKEESRHKKEESGHKKEESKHEDESDDEEEEWEEEEESEEEKWEEEESEEEELEEEESEEEELEEEEESEE